MAWVALVFAGLFEVVGVLGINRWKERRDAIGITLLVGGFALSFVLLTIAMNSLSMGTAYAIWTGIGTIGGTAVGMAFFGESRKPVRLFFLGLVVVSAIGLKLIE
ncbi:DMT family transporter [Cohnella faecalis]|uniref:QacE family quaternary ammonium compound efflux SMR transporter n=1 Tax=Cohnella faecalis TaxID=2315694 RepID=A0A398CLM2_9BACL|nr:multidrug efflux SMR transporter [Cohnella faecalis]RIE02119.1 QacE family quaternary ammonium compound efflux SMR transporter [Cohnella faecalis]